jgi:hypothetical protein
MAQGGLALASGIEGLKEMGTQIVVILAGSQYVVDDGEQAVTDRDHRPLLANAAGV